MDDTWKPFVIVLGALFVLPLPVDCYGFIPKIFYKTGQTHRESNGRILRLSYIVVRIFTYLTLLIFLITCKITIIGHFAPLEAWIWGPYFISFLSPLFGVGLFERHSIYMHIHIHDGKMIHRALDLPKFRVIKYKSKSV